MQVDYLITQFFNFDSVPVVFTVDFQIYFCCHLKRGKNPIVLRRRIQLREVGMVQEAQEVYFKFIIYLCYLLLVYLRLLIGIFLVLGSNIFDLKFFSSSLKNFL